VPPGQPLATRERSLAGRTATTSPLVGSLVLMISCRGIGDLVDEVGAVEHTVVAMDASRPHLEGA